MTLCLCITNCEGPIVVGRFRILGGAGGGGGRGGQGLEYLGTKGRARLRILGGQGGGGEFPAGT